MILIFKPILITFYFYLSSVSSLILNTNSINFRVNQYEESEIKVEILPLDSPVISQGAHLFHEITVIGLCCSITVITIVLIEYIGYKRSIRNEEIYQVIEQFQNYSQNYAQLQNSHTAELNQFHEILGSLHNTVHNLQTQLEILGVQHENMNSIVVSLVAQAA